MEQPIDQVAQVTERQGGSDLQAAAAAFEFVRPAVSGSGRPAPAAPALERKDTVEISRAARQAAQEDARASRSSGGEAPEIRRPEPVTRPDAEKPVLKHREVQFNRDLGILTGKIQAGDRTVEIPPEAVVETRMRIKAHVQEFVRQSHEHEESGIDILGSGASETGAEGEAA